MVFSKKGYDDFDLVLLFKYLSNIVSTEAVRFHAHQTANNVLVSDRTIPLQQFLEVFKYNVVCQCVFALVVVALAKKQQPKNLQYRHTFVCQRIYLDWVIFFVCLSFYKSVCQA